ncbi:hypothetical protein Rt10032_c16g5646 [Rhodotorula toruloides]|uniref:DUF7923 domain-containing protein n=1 Tax=Rhodotorula toruloides TaxID=5286 RepID=A0A511KMK9_RHOTO|nr:hypothetical protein Rt10032_c16g5646 [Rhodotorula toruloides]
MSMSVRSLGSVRASKLLITSSVADRNSVAEHTTAILTKFGFMGNVEKIYVAGAHPGMTLLPLVVQDEEGPPEELEKAFEEVVLPKIVLIDHRPNEPKEDLGSPTVTLTGFFDSSSPIVLLAQQRIQPFRVVQALRLVPAPSSDTSSRAAIVPRETALGLTTTSAGEDVAKQPCPGMRKTRECRWDEIYRLGIARAVVLPVHSVIPPSSARGIHSVFVRSLPKFFSNHAVAMPGLVDVDTQASDSPAAVIQRGASEHQQLLESHDALIYRLMEDKVKLGMGVDEEQDAVDKLKQAKTATTTLAELSGTKEVQEAQIGAQEDELATWKSTVAESKRKSEELGRQVREEEVKVREDLANAPQRQAKAAGRSTLVTGNPFILVLIDGSAAPFNEDAIKQGVSSGIDMAPRSLGEHNIELDEDDEEKVPPVVVSIVWHNRKALVYKLGNNKVAPEGFRGDEQWDRFPAGWTSLRNNQVIDVGEAPIDRRMANMIELYGQAPNLKRIFLAGIHLETLPDSCETLKPGSGQFFIRVAPKLVLINHRETDDEREVLKGSGWGVAVFARFFSSNNGLVTDLGWVFRPVTPPVGPGDQNHEEGDD